MFIYGANGTPEWNKNSPEKWKLENKKIKRKFKTYAP